MEVNIVGFKLSGGDFFLAFMISPQITYLAQGASRNKDDKERNRISKQYSTKKSESPI